MSVLNLNGLKVNVKSILDTANMVGGNPIDLSNGLITRVQKVLTVNVSKLPIQASLFPCVTMFFEAKKIVNTDIAKNLILGRRMADIDLKIVGLVWIDNMSTAGFELEDLADNECENLMENLEQVLRLDATLGGLALHAYPSDTTYHSFPVAEQAHMRAGIMNFKIKALY